MKLVVAVVVALISSGVASAAPITWSYSGTTSTNPFAFGSTIAAIPNGTFVTLDWTFDTAQPNACATAGAHVGGLYANQSATLTFASLLGLITYQGSGLFSAGHSIDGACGGPSGSIMEVRLPFWYGPNLPDARLVNDQRNAPGLFWLDPSTDGGFPLSQPQNVLFRGPSFYPTEAWAGLTATPEPASSIAHTPEPATLGMLALGFVGLAISLRRRHQ